MYARGESNSFLWRGAIFALIKKSNALLFH